MLKPYQKNIIDSMVRQELLLAKLYKLFAGQFAEHGTLWAELAKEEEKHALWLQQLYEAGEKGIILFDEGKTKTYTLKTFIDYQEGIIARAENQEFGLAGAVACTLDMEQSLIEKNVFSCFDATSEKVRTVLKRLAGETAKHIEKVQMIKALKDAEPVGGEQ